MHFIEFFKAKKADFPALVSWLIFLLIWAAFAGLLLLLTWHDSYDFDTWYHLKAGQIFLQKGLITHDIFSFTEKGRLWIPVEWLSEIFMALVMQLWGMPALRFMVDI